MKSSNKGLAYAVVTLCKEMDLTIATVESCTAGMLSSTITEIPGSSKVFELGIVTYSSASKIEVLGVQASVINEYSDVSKETALQMIQSLKKFIRSDFYISITGIAGPSGGSSTKPVGTVFIGIDFHGEVVVSKNIFQGNRENIRSCAVQKALECIYQKLKDRITLSEQKTLS